MLSVKSKLDDCSNGQSKQKRRRTESVGDQGQEGEDEDGEVKQLSESECHNARAQIQKTHTMKSEICSNNFFQPKKSCLNTVCKNTNPSKSNVDQDKKSNQEFTSVNEFISSTSKRNPIKIRETESVINSKAHLPLAERMRPMNLQEFIGQLNVIGPKKQLRAVLEKGDIPSLILWGPPGCGKTTLAKIISSTAKNHGFNISMLSATTARVADIKEVAIKAKNDLKMFRKRTLMVVDEIHHFNKLQQDTFLPYVEDGTITLIGATTENPSFQLNNALLSRCRVIVLDKLAPDDIHRILERALVALCVRKESEVRSEPEIHRSGDQQCPAETEESATSIGLTISESAVHQLSVLCDGDARAALNCLDMVVRSITAESGSSMCITAKHIVDSLQRSHVQYDRAGEEHYNCASALQKSIRGSSDNGALYWVARMMEGGEDPLFIARRLIRTASEDIGLADPLALTQAVAAFQACHLIGKPECDVILAQCAVYLARAPKPTTQMSTALAYDAAVSCIRNHQGPLPGVPLHLRNASTKLMRDLGYGKGYQYQSNDKDSQQTYLPDGLLHLNFFQ